jgi:hypothetical protein
MDADRTAYRALGGGDDEQRQQQQQQHVLLAEEAEDELSVTLSSHLPTQLLEGAARRSAGPGEWLRHKLAGFGGHGAPAPIARLSHARWCACRVLPVTACALVATLALAFFAGVPHVGQIVMDQSTMNVLRMHMKLPTATAITLNATVELHDTGPFDAVMYGSRCEVVHEGVVLAQMWMPELHLRGGEPLHFSMESEMLVLNVTAFTKATAQILQGVGGVWYIRGEPEVSVGLLGLTRRFKVALNKPFVVPPTLLEDVRAFDTLVLDRSTRDSFAISSTTTFFSSSILELFHLGLFQFDLEVLVDKRTGAVVDDAAAYEAAQAQRTNNDVELVKLGRVSMQDFDLRQGVNRLNATGDVVKTERNANVLSQFVSAFMDGATQRAIIRGPVHAASPFLNDVVTQAISFEGLPDRPIDGSYIDARTLNGFSVRLPRADGDGNAHGDALALAADDNGAVHYRGAIVVGHNPLNRNLRQRDIVTEVRFSEPLGYDLNNALLGKWHCPTSTAMAELFSAPGMYEGNASRPAVIDMPPNERVTFFLPGRPLPGQITQKPCTVLGVKVAGDYDCCMVSVQAAASCRAKAHGRKTFDVDIDSRFLLELGDFSLALRSRQTKTPTLFADEMTAGFLLDAELQCSEFDFF